MRLRAGVAWPVSTSLVWETACQTSARMNARMARQTGELEPERHAAAVSSA
jgi:hypothetical protein